MSDLAVYGVPGSPIARSVLTMTAARVAQAAA